jgi:hypothetical protein
MSHHLSQHKPITPRQEASLIVLAFMVWMFVFRDFLSGRLLLLDDAVSYYDHVKFLLDNVRRGVLPLWDPLWFFGVANNFFLQRMGLFNPFIMLPNVFHTVGIPYTQSYLLYLASYYFVGCLGFYVLARRLLDDKVCAFAGFLLLLFSALGTRIFDSYMVLMFTPIVWFFYFLVSFSLEPRRHSFVGLIFSLLTIFTTYIPFYFFLVFVSFLIFYGLFYGNTLGSLWRKYVRFARENKILVALCILILAASLIPGYMFFKTSGGKGEFVMPARNSDTTVGSVLGVQRQDTSNSWSILEEIFFARYYYTDMTLIKFAVLYIPILSAVIFFLGFLTKANRNLLFLFAWGSGLLILCIPAASPVYAFLYKHVFLFKYFRNLHFLLWIALLPIFCLFLAGQLKTFLSWRPGSWKEKAAVFVYLSVIHGVLLGFIHWHQFSVVSSYFALILSYAFFLWRLFGSWRKIQGMTMLLLLVIVAVEPIEVYKYLGENSQAYHKYAYSYDLTDLDFHYTRFDNDIDMALHDAPEVLYAGERKDGARFVRPSRSIYYASKWYGYLAGNIDYDILTKYRRPRFILYDRVERLPDDNIDFLAFETSLAENRNTAFVSTDDPAVLAVQSQGRQSYYAQALEGDSETFRVIKYNANGVKLKTDFAEPKFLVYNDSYQRQWRVKIDGRPATLVRANIAFKGVWVPAGHHTVEFSFGAWHLWALYTFLFIASYGLFLLIILFRRQEARRSREVSS